MFTNDVYLRTQPPSMIQNLLWFLSNNYVRRVGLQQQRIIFSTFSLLDYYVLKYPLKYAPAVLTVHTSLDISITFDDRTHYLLGTLPLTNELLCRIRMCLHYWKNVLCFASFVDYIRS